VGWEPSYAKEFKPPEKLGPTEFDYSTINHFLSSGQKGILTAFKGGSEMRGTDLQLSYWLTEKVSFIGEYLIMNATDESVDFMILSLIDYRQQEFFLNDRLSHRHSITVQPGEQVITKVNLAPLQEGSHDFILLALKMPDPAASSPEGDYLVLSHRANLFVGDLAFPQVNYQPLGTNPGSEQITFSPVIKKGKIKDYFVHINNGGNFPIKLAMITLLNGKQIPVNSDTGQQILYGEVAAYRQEVLKLKLAGPNCQEDGCELSVLSIENPYVVLEPEAGVMAQIPTRIRAANLLRLYPARK
jgi:hypothetical protein